MTAISISECRDQSVNAMSITSGLRVVPAGPWVYHGLRPIPLTPPPVRSPSISSTSSLISFLSSHSDFNLLDVEEVELPPPSPAWPSELLSPSSDFTPSIILSSEPSLGPMLSLTPPGRMSSKTNETN